MKIYQKPDAEFISLVMQEETTDSTDIPQVGGSVVSNIF